LVDTFPSVVNVPLYVGNATLVVYVSVAVIVTAPDVAPLRVALVTMVGDVIVGDPENTTLPAVPVTPVRILRNWVAVVVDSWSSRGRNHVGALVPLDDRSCPELPTVVKSVAPEPV
jgi:hypothetical protein